MAINQLKVKYAGSRLGIWWAVIIPLLLALSINFVFEVISRITVVNYTIFVLSGILPWLFFTGALSEATNAFVANVSILKQSRCPHEFLPVSVILSNLLNFFIGFIFLLPLFLFINLKTITLLPVLLAVIALQAVFIIGLGLIFSTLNVFFRDLTHFLSIAFTVWFWVTPIFYSLEMVNFPYRWICLFNPVTAFVTSYQKILFEAKFPGLPVLSICLALAAISLVGGYLVFIKQEPELLKRI
jgi:ABC-2 type transport system permease protein